MPRFLQLVALALTFFMSGAPAVASELLEDDCEEKCSDESRCPTEGCGDCSIVCSSCPRSHVLPASLTATIVPALGNFSWLSSEALQRVPDDPVPRGVFHPPRHVAG